MEFNVGFHVRVNLGIFCKGTNVETRIIISIGIDVEILRETRNRNPTQVLAYGFIQEFILGYKK